MRELDLMGLAGWRCVTHPQPAPMYVTAVLILEQIASDALKFLTRNQIFHDISTVEGSACCLQFRAERCYRFR